SWWTPLTGRSPRRCGSPGSGCWHGCDPTCCFVRPPGRVAAGVNATNDVCVAVIYYSATGTTHEMAKAAADGAEKAGAQTRLRRGAGIAPPGGSEANGGSAPNLQRGSDAP